MYPGPPIIKDDIEKTLNQKIEKHITQMKRQQKLCPLPYKKDRKDKVDNYKRIFILSSIYGETIKNKLISNIKVLRPKDNLS